MLTLVVHVLLIVFSPSNVITNEQNSATMVTINLKVSMCRDTIANSNITKVFVVNPCDSCNTDVDTPLNVIHVHMSQSSTVYIGIAMVYPHIIRFFITFTFSLLLTGFLLT